MSQEQRLCPGVEAVGDGHSCAPYLGTRTQRARCRGVKCTADVTLTFLRIGLWRSGKHF